MINLLPFSARETIDYAGRIHSLNRFSFLVLTILAGVAFIYGSSIFFLSQQEETLDKSVQAQLQTLNTLDPILTRADSVEKKINIAGDILDVEVQFSELLVELGGVLPSGTSIEGIALGEDLSAPLTITVFADNYTDALAGVVRENIVSSELFTQADIQNINLGQSSGDEEASGSKTTIVVVALLKNDGPIVRPAPADQSDTLEDEADSEL